MSSIMGWIIMKASKVTQNVSKHLVWLPAERIGNKNARSKEPVSSEIGLLFQTNPIH